MEIDTHTTGPQGTPAASQRQPVTNADTGAPQPPERVDALVLPRAALVAFFRSWRGRRCRSLIGSSATVRWARTVYARVVPATATLDPNRMVTAGELFGADDWKDLRRAYQVCAGIFIAFVVSSTDLLPLRMHQTRSGKGTKKYWRHWKTPHPFHRGSRSAPTSSAQEQCSAGNASKTNVQTVLT